MECIICKNGNTKEGTDVLTFEMDGHLIIIRDVPGEVCGYCGHFYISAATSIDVQKKIGNASTRDTELKMLRYG